jgi:hypothetical protein
MHILLGGLAAIVIMLLWVSGALFHLCAVLCGCASYRPRPRGRRATGEREPHGAGAGHDGEALLEAPASRRS